MITQLHIPMSERPADPSETLLYFDFPLMFWLTEVRGYPYLAISLHGLHAGPSPYLVIRMTAYARARYEAGELPLRKAILEGEACYVMPDYGAEVLELAPVTSLPECWLP